MKQINITEGINVGGFHYKVDMSEEAHRMLLSEANYGHCDGRNKIIRIDKGESEAENSETFIHEMLEAVNKTYCTSKLDHDLLSQISCGIHQVMEGLKVRFGNFPEEN